jgi:hypothetical protein
MTQSCQAEKSAARGPIGSRFSLYPARQKKEIPPRRAQCERGFDSSASNATIRQSSDVFGRPRDGRVTRQMPGELPALPGTTGTNDGYAVAQPVCLAGDFGIGPTLRFAINMSR